MDTPLMNSVCHMMMMWSPVKRKKLLLILCITISTTAVDVTTRADILTHA